MEDNIENKNDSKINDSGDIPESDFVWPDPQAKTAFPIAKTGYPIIGAFAFVTLIFAVLQFKIIALVFLFLTLFVTMFFRDPDRVIPKDKGAVVSPADGKVIFVGIVDENPHVPGPCLKISVFMNVFNVHVNRVPCDGVVRKTAYNPGKFFSANLDKASLENEHNAVTVETPDGKTVGFVQIAGLVARRIICDIGEKDTVRRGRRFGIICLGSRLDIYLPADAKPAVEKGRKVQAGTCIIGWLS